MAMKLEYVKVAKYVKPKVCKYNDGCECTDKNCYNCGWNPTVAKIRLYEIRKKLLEAGNG